MGLVRQVSRDSTTDKLTVLFAPDHTVILEGKLAADFLNMLGCLKSEATLAMNGVKREEAAKNTPNKEPKPPHKPSGKGGAWS